MKNSGLGTLCRFTIFEKTLTECRDKTTGNVGMAAAVPLFFMHRGAQKK